MGHYAAEKSLPYCFAEYCRLKSASEELTLSASESPRQSKANPQDRGHIDKHRQQKSVVIISPPVTLPLVCVRGVRSIGYRTVIFAPHGPPSGSLISSFVFPTTMENPMDKQPDCSDKSGTGCQQASICAQILQGN